MTKQGNEPQVQLATRIPKSLHRALKLHCVDADVSLMDFLVAALREKLGKAGGRKRAGRDG
jgi:predicted HicB family RNase H-like nuclease